MAKFVRINRWAGALSVVNPVGDTVEVSDELAERLCAKNDEHGAYGNLVEKPKKEEGKKEEGK
jgi:hypothetical protein